MEIKKIKLNNIRSYKEQEIEFSKGSTLLSGDIGSGKTSVLLGIEFALFGLQPGQRGSSLLRNGETTGGVIMDFEVDGKLITIERTLKKAKTVSQDYCAITIDQEKRELSVTELKSKILEILEYPKEFSKKQNILYKFTVYTPQEEMKQIILQDSETRINTLRHVFGIDKYKRVLENISIAISKIKEEKKFKQGITMNLESDKEQIKNKEQDLESKHLGLVSIDQELSLKIEFRKKIQNEKQEITQKIEEKNKLKQETEKTKIIISSKNSSIADNKKMVSQLRIQIEELNKSQIDESQIPKLEQEIQLLKNKKTELNESNLQITTKISSFEMKNNENDIVLSKISHIDVCPTCLQDVDPVYKSNVVNKLESNTTENVKNIKEFTLEKIQVSKELSEIEADISLKEKEVQELNFLKIRLKGIEEKQIRLNEIEKSNILLKKDTELLDQHIEVLQKNIFELSKYDNIFEKKTKELEEALSQERLAEIKVAELKREIELFTIQIQELKQRVKEIEDIREQLIYLNDLEDWLSKKFMPVISYIEKNVMVRLKSEFSMLFGEWFNMLVAETFNVRLDDNFTPIIEQQDYEIDYAYLSGGERTAVALAYRLALNQVINSLMSKIKTRDLVILDEPTDGFSEQQLDKMRDILIELNVGQLIIVSHEQKIESFVENVVRFKKEKGVSGIEA